jgi:hypothetical protein
MLSKLEWERTSGSVGLSVFADESRLQICGSAVELGRLADEIEEHAREAEEGDCRDIEHYPGHDYLAVGSTPMRVWVVVSPPDPTEPSEPVTLIGAYLVASATGNGPAMRAYEKMLPETVLHDDNGVLIAVVYELVERRWPIDPDPAGVDEAVRRAVAMARRPDLVDADALRRVIGTALGEPVEDTSDVEVQMIHRLFAVWAFVRQMGLEAEAVTAIVSRAEQRAIQAGCSPTARADLLDDQTK